jgi:hypothetical protein
VLAMGGVYGSKPSLASTRHLLRATDAGNCSKGQIAGNLGLARQSAGKQVAHALHEVAC